MNKISNLTVIVCISVFISSCSIYKTSSQDIVFTGTEFYEPAVLPMGDMAIDNQNKRFMGWVEAYVTSPGWFKEAPTEQQVNYVLAHQAKQQGADAVMHLSYKKTITATGKSRIIAKGQAIQLLQDKSQQDESFTESFVDEELEQKDSVAVLTADTSTKQREKFTNESIAASIEHRVEGKFVSGLDDEQALSDEAMNTVQSSQLLIKQAARYQADKAGSASALLLKPEPKEAKDTSGVQLLSYLNQYYQDELNRIQLMQNNALYLKQQALQHKNKAMLNAAERLIEQLDLQKQAFDRFAP